MPCSPLGTLVLESMGLVLMVGLQYPCPRSRYLDISEAYILLRLCLEESD